MTTPNPSPQPTADGPPTELCKHCGRTYGSHYYPGAYCASGGTCYDPMTTPQPTAESGQPERRVERQDRIGKWAVAAFGEVEATSLPQRGVRLLEEAAEAAQSTGVSLGQAKHLMEYVWGRPAGELYQELGGVGVTALALAHAAGLDADNCEVLEVNRVLLKPIEHFTRRNQEKNDAGLRAAPPAESERPSTEQPEFVCECGKWYRLQDSTAPHSKNIYCSSECRDKDLGLERVSMSTEKAESPADAWQRGVEAGYHAAWEDGAVVCPKLRYRAPKSALLKPQGETPEGGRPVVVASGDEELMYWANMGGAPIIINGAQLMCESNPRDVHKIYGSSHTSKKTMKPVCLVHALHESECEVRELEAKLAASLPPSEPVSPQRPTEAQVLGERFTKVVLILDEAVDAWPTEVHAYRELMLRMLKILVPFRVSESPLPGREARRRIYTAEDISNVVHPEDSAAPQLSVRPEAPPDGICAHSSVPHRQSPHCARWEELMTQAAPREEE